MMARKKLSTHSPDKAAKLMRSKSGFDYKLYPLIASIRPDDDSIYERCPDGSRVVADLKETNRRVIVCVSDHAPFVYHFIIFSIDAESEFLVHLDNNRAHDPQYATQVIRDALAEYQYRSCQIQMQHRAVLIKEGECGRIIH